MLCESTASQSAQGIVGISTWVKRNMQAIRQILHEMGVEIPRFDDVTSSIEEGYGVVKNVDRDK